MVCSMRMKVTVQIRTQSDFCMLGPLQPARGALEGAWVEQCLDPGEFFEMRYLVVRYSMSLARIYEGGKAYAYIKRRLDIEGFQLSPTTAKEVDGILKRVPVGLAWRMGCSCVDAEYDAALLSLKGLFRLFGAEIRHGFGVQGFGVKPV